MRNSKSSVKNRSKKRRPRRKAKPRSLSPLEYRELGAEIHRRHIEGILEDARKRRPVSAIDVLPEVAGPETPLFDESTKGTPWGGRKYGDNLKPRGRSTRKK